MRARANGTAAQPTQKLTERNPTLPLCIQEYLIHRREPDHQSKGTIECIRRHHIRILERRGLKQPALVELFSVAWVRLAEVVTEGLQVVLNRCLDGQCRQGRAGGDPTATFVCLTKDSILILRLDESTKQNGRA
jgi:hypothetical protein